MRFVSLLGLFLLLSVASAQEANHQQSPPPQTIPTTLAETHAELERTLSPKTLAEIDVLASENDMIRYHMGLGMGLRNSWGLWRDSALARHLRELGFTHPDDMSGVILETFWCKRHGRPLRLEERAAATKESMEATQKEEEEVESRWSGRAWQHLNAMRPTGGRERGTIPCRLTSHLTHPTSRRLAGRKLLLTCGY